MNKACLYLTCALCVLAQTSVARTWTDVEGREIEADLVSATSAQCVLQSGQRQVVIALNVLSDVDQRYVKNYLLDAKLKHVEQSLNAAISTPPTTNANDPSLVMRRMLAARSAAEQAQAAKLAASEARFNAAKSQRAAASKRAAARCVT